MKADYSKLAALLEKQRTEVDSMRMQFDVFERLPDEIAALNPFIHVHSLYGSVASVKIGSSQNGFSLSDALALFSKMKVCGVTPVCTGGFVALYPSSRALKENEHPRHGSGYFGVWVRADEFGACAKAYVKLRKYPLPNAAKDDTYDIVRVEIELKEKHRYIRFDAENGGKVSERTERFKTVGTLKCNQLVQYSGAPNGGKGEVNYFWLTREDLARMLSAGE